MRQAPRIISLLDAVGVGANPSGKIYIGAAKRGVLRLTRAGHTSGDTAWAIKGGYSPVDAAVAGITMSPYEMGVHGVANTNAQTLKRASAVAQAANGTIFIYFNFEEFPISHLEADATVTTDGTASADLILFDEE